jgi:hypothetical protein
MSIATNLRGRVRNTELPRSSALLPLFEAVVNSIQSVDERHGGGSGAGSINIRVVREPQAGLPLEDKPRRGAPPMENILDFEIADDGVGFTDENLTSFETLDSEYKQALGGRGVGRLLWLKAFESVVIDSVYADPTENAKRRRRFRFSEAQGIADAEISPAEGAEFLTTVSLRGFARDYREAAPKGVAAIAQDILEHCLSYFLRRGGAPNITISDQDERVSLRDVFDSYVNADTTTTHLTVRGQSFDAVHVRMRGTPHAHMLAWCANDRVVASEKLERKIPGISARLTDNDGSPYTYSCFVMSDYFDQKVRPERFGFNIPENDAGDGLFSESEPPLSEIRAEALRAANAFLSSDLEGARQAGRARIEEFATKRAPRYKPILRHLSDEEFFVDPDISEKDLDTLLHKKFVDVEAQMIAQGHDIMKVDVGERFDEYKDRLAEYLSTLSDLKQSDLAGYVGRRRLIIEFLRHAIERGADGKYKREDVLHELLMPMRTTSDQVRFDDANLWLIDERLAFHDFLASDKPLSSLPIIQTTSSKEPDLCILNFNDDPVLLSESRDSCPASLTIIELKRPMRADIGVGDEDPVKQCLDYLSRIRKGKVQTKAGRPIQGTEDIPGFCYVVCDVLDGMEECIKNWSLKRTSDKRGYFGYHQGHDAYIEIITYDRLISSALERHRAFFDRLGLPKN